MQLPCQNKTTNRKHESHTKLNTEIKQLLFLIRPLSAHSWDKSNLKPNIGFYTLLLRKYIFSSVIKPRYHYSSGTEMLCLFYGCCNWDLHSSCYRLLLAYSAIASLKFTLDKQVRRILRIKINQDVSYHVMLLAIFQWFTFFGSLWSIAGMYEDLM